MWIRTSSRAGCGLLLWSLAWALAGCGGTASATLQPGASATVPGVPAPVEPPAGATAAASPAATSGLAGVIFAASDVSGQPDTPLPDQAVVALPEAEAAGAFGLDSLPGDDQLRFLKGTLAEGPGVGVAVSDAQGQYSLRLPPGRYILCVGEENTAAPVSFPLRTRGCGQVEIPQAGVKAVDISSGFGEILLVER